METSYHSKTQAKHKNKKLALMSFLGVLAMFGLAFAAVPAYKLFCQVTGYAGTPKIDKSLTKREISEHPQKHLKIRFNANVASGLKWKFAPEQTEIQVEIGKDHLATYTAHNISEHSIIGTSTFNVTPMKAAQYFSKVECFCFTEQRLDPGEKARLPVMFYIDPEIMKDDQVEDVKTITLSYTFFPVTQQAAFEK